MKGNFPCSKELRQIICTDKQDMPRSFCSNSKDRVKICLGCSILKMTIEEKSIDDISVTLGMNPHTAATFRNGILWRLNNNDGVKGYYLEPFIHQS